MKRIWKVGRIVFAMLITMLVLTIGASATEIKLGVGLVEASALRLRSEPSTEGTVLDSSPFTIF